MPNFARDCLINHGARKAAFQIWHCFHLLVGYSWTNLQKLLKIFRFMGKNKIELIWSSIEVGTPVYELANLILLLFQ